jgi:flagellar motor switch protein FliN
MSTNTPETLAGSAESAAGGWAASMNQAPAAAADRLFEKFGDAPAGAARNDIELVLDIPVQLSVELGRTRIPIKNILQLAQGSVIELDGLAGEPLDVMVNGCLIAQGEVVVVGERFGIRLTDIITPSERIRKLNR